MSSGSSKVDQFFQLGASATVIARGKVKRSTIALCRNCYNYYSYGKLAPRFGERVWVDADYCRLYFTETYISHMLGVARPLEGSGVVLKRAWPYEKAISVNALWKIRCCIAHWVYGVPWENTGVYDYSLRRIAWRGQFDGCKTREDIVRRYEQLDAIFEQVKSEGRLRTEEELHRSRERASGEPMVHIGPHGEPFFGGGGYHRFAMAHALQLRLPARVGIVHLSAIPELPAFRKAPATK